MLATAKSKFSCLKNELNVIVTGASGFIGKQVVLGLLKKGYKVYGVSRKLVGPYKYNNLSWVSWNNLTSSIPSDIDIYAVINLATTYGHNNESWAEILESNTTLPLELFKYAIALGAKKIINTDSFFGKPIFNYSHLKHYTKSKKKLVDLTKELTTQKKVTFVNMRLEHVYGANDGPNKFVSKLIRDFHYSKNRIDLTDGTQRRDFIYIDDVVSAFLIVVNYKFNEGFFEFEVGTGSSIELKNFCKELANVFNFSQCALNFGAIDQRPNEIMDSYADSSGLNALGWAPAYNLKNSLLDLKKKQTVQE